MDNRILITKNTKSWVVVEFDMASETSVKLFSTFAPKWIEMTPIIMPPSTAFKPLIAISLRLIWFKIAVSKAKKSALGFDSQITA